MHLLQADFLHVLIKLILSSQLLTGGTLLSRDREFIVFYRGKDFLPFAVSSAIEQQRYIRLQKMKQMDNALSTTVQEKKLEINERGPTNGSQSITEWKRVVSEQRKLISSETSMRKTTIKLSIVCLH